MAVRKTFPRATASIEDAAYGRSLTYCARLKATSRGALRPCWRTSAIGSTSRSRATVHRSSVASG
jgi:hypothetical protein